MEMIQVDEHIFPMVVGEKPPTRKLGEDSAGRFEKTDAGVG